MSLVDQIFEQAKLGTAPNPDANPFAGGLQLGLQQQHLNQQAQELAMEIAQAPLKQTLLQQDAAYKAAQTTALLYEQQTKVQSEEAIAGLAGKIHDVQTEATMEDALPYFLEAVHKNPRIADDTRFQRIWQDYNTSLNAKLELQKAKVFEQPEIRYVKDPKTGEDVRMIREGPNSWKPDTEQSIEVTSPEGTTFKQIIGGAGGRGVQPNGLNQAVNTQLEEKLAATSRSAALLDESIGLISPENIGPRGKVGAALEKGANILYPGSMATPITKAQQTFNTTAQAQYNSLKADSQINKMEAAAMSKIANITDWWEAAATAKEKYQTLRDLTGLQAVLMSHKLNRITPDDLLKGMSADAIDKYLKQGTVTKAEAARWIDLHGGNEAVERMLLEQGK